MMTSSHKQGDLTSSLGLINSLGAPSTRPCESCSNKPSLCTRIFYLLLPSICHRQWSHLPLLTLHQRQGKLFPENGHLGATGYTSMQARVTACSRLAALMTCVVLRDIIPDWHVKIIEWMVCSPIWHPPIWECTSVSLMLAFQIFWCTAIGYDFEAN